MNFGFLLSLTFILIVTSVFSKNSNDILTRRKRYLVFPEGASMTVSYNFLLFNPAKLRLLLSITCNLP